MKTILSALTISLFALCTIPALAHKGVPTPTNIAGLVSNPTVVEPAADDTVSQPQKPPKNRLSRKTLLNAANNARKDTLAVGKRVTCDKNTTAIIIEVSVTTNPYTIVADSLGLTLQIFSNDKSAFNEFYEYKDSNFDKIKAMVNASKLTVVKERKDTVPYLANLEVKFNNETGSYAILTNKLGIVNYKGNLLKVVSYIESLIPDFETLINSEYRDPDDFTDGNAYINYMLVKPCELKEISGILAVPLGATPVPINPTDDKTLSIDLKMPYKNANGLRLLKVNRYSNKKKKNAIYGFTYENIVKDGISATSIKTTNNGIVTAEFSVETLENGTYCIYNPLKNTVYLFDITNE